MTIISKTRTITQEKAEWQLISCKKDRGCCPNGSKKYYRYAYYIEEEFNVHLYAVQYCLTWFSSEYEVLSLIFHVHIPSVLMG